MVSNEYPFPESGDIFASPTFIIRMGYDSAIVGTLTANASGDTSYITTRGQKGLYVMIRSAGDLNFGLYGTEDDGEGHPDTDYEYEILNSSDAHIVKSHTGLDYHIYQFPDVFAPYIKLRLTDTSGSSNAFKVRLM